MLTPGTYLQNRYEILEKIGSGGMSVVYKARCHTLNRLVGIKVLKEEFAFDESFVGKFKMEAQAAARLSHPNIVSVYDVVNEDALHYIVMELIDGITLKNYIENKGYLESREAIGIAIQVAQGIAAAHEQHIIHRDIKPQNMIISKDGKVKVADFGIARAVSAQTMNATAVGSVHYISPEQARGGYCDERSDIYSFGITLYEMVTGKVPFEGDNTVTVALAHLEEPAAHPSEHVPDMSVALEQIILKCIQKRPERRYASMLDVIADLRKALVNPDCDIYRTEDGEEDEMGKTRSISREELNAIQEARKVPREGDTETSGKSSREEGPEEDQEADGHQEPEAPRSRGGHRRKPAGHGVSRQKGTDVSSQFERIVTAIGIVAAILIVAVVLFVFTRLTGLFRAGSEGNNAPTVVTTAAPVPDSEIDITDNQTYMPDVLGLPRDMAEAKLKESTLVMKVSGVDYSDKYPEGQVKAQAVAEGTVVDKWSTVSVTVSKGSDKVSLSSLNLHKMTGTEAANALQEKGLTPETKEEFNDTVPKGNVIRVTPEVAKVGESVQLFVSKGPQSEVGKVPNLLGQTQTSADALLAGAGLATGAVTVESSSTVEEGLIISQRYQAGTVLTPGTAVDYVISGNPEESTEADDGRYYIGSIDTSCSLSNYIGPAAQTSSVRVQVRLKQTISGADIYTPLISARLVVGAQTVPVVIPKIKGAYGVDSGTVEVVDADKMNVIASYPVTFFPAG